MFIESVWDRKSCYDCCHLQYGMDSFWCGGGRDLGWSVVIPAWCPDKKRHLFLSVAEKLKKVMRARK